MCLEKLELLLHPLVADTGLSLHIPRHYSHQSIESLSSRASEIVIVEHTNEFPRRFDHGFASELLDAAEASYLHEYDDLSDHTPLEVTVASRAELHEGVEEIGRTGYTPASAQRLRPCNRPAGGARVRPPRRLLKKRFLEWNSEQKEEDESFEEFDNLVNDRLDDILE